MQKKIPPKNIYKKNILAQVKGGGLEDSGGGSNTEDEEEEEEDEFEDAKTDLDYEDFTVSAPPQHRCWRAATAL
jgi:hypothetical protein